MCYRFRLCSVHIYLSNTLLFLPEQGSLLRCLLVLLHQTFQLHLQLLCVLQNLILQGRHRKLCFPPGEEGREAVEIAKASEVQQEQEEQQDLPSPCAAVSPPHPDWSQTEPQWRCC